MNNAVRFSLAVLTSSIATIGASAHVTSAQGTQATPSTPATLGMPSAQPPATATSPALTMLDEKSKRGLGTQVALDRAGFSPGEIDGAPGTNTERALAAFKARHGTSDLGEGFANPVIAYTVTPEDAAASFVESMPEDMMEKSKLPSLGYASVLEMLAERFHASPKLLQRLNPKATYASGTTVLVPNVEPFLAPMPRGATPSTTATGNSTSATPATAAGNTAPRAPAAGSTQGAAEQPRSAAAKKSAVTITVTDKTKTLQVQDAEGQIIFHAPVTVGSQNDPLPVGEWKVNGVSRNPVFNYNPQLFWDADPAHAKAKIAAGPNNPVGSVWVDLSKEHYGIHGTPEPSRIGYTQSHGCIRLTNWDAMRVADLVSPGTKVILQ